jgi:AraC-like DNA-binding protein
MMTPPSRCRVPEREPATPLRLNIAPGVIAVHASQTVVILEPLHGSEIRVRDVASGIEKIVPVCELSGAALGLSRKDTQRRLETLRGVTRDEWLRARRRERVVRRLIRSDGEIAERCASCAELSPRY